MSILRADAVETVAYYHLELDRHDVIFAEGAAAETFVDCDKGRIDSAADAVLQTGLSAA